MKFLIIRTQVWTWVIGQTGIRNCMYPHTISNPCLSDHPRPYASTIPFGFSSSLVRPFDRYAIYPPQQNDSPSS